MSVVSRANKARRDDDNERSAPLRALSVVLDHRIGDVLAENARLRDQVEKTEHELEVWCGGATAPEVGRYYGIDSSILGPPGFRAAFWGDCLDSTHISQSLLSANNVRPTETHVPSTSLAFRYIGAYDDEYIQQRTQWRDLETYLDRVFRFEVPFIGDSLDFDHDATECPSLYTDEGLAIVEIRQVHLHHVRRMDDGEDEVRPTGAPGRFGELPRWLVWYKKRSV